MAERARPTLRCLREDLGLLVPRADKPLDEVAHPLLEKATERFADDQTPHERISSIDDQVLLKVKVQRWRGAVWVDADRPWLVAAGRREEGSPDDFYAALTARAQAARARYNAERTPPLASATHATYLLPGHEDELRWRAEAAVRADRRLRAIIHDLVCQSLLDGREHAAMLDGAAHQQFQRGRVPAALSRYSGGEGSGTAQIWVYRQARHGLSRPRPVLDGAGEAGTLSGCRPGPRL